MESLFSSLFVIGFLAFLVKLEQVERHLKRLDYRMGLILQHLNVDLGVGTQLSEQVQTLARDPRRRIEAIKLYREETGAGLREAKEAIEAFRTNVDH